MDFTIKEEDDRKQVMLSGSFTFADNQKFKQMMVTLDKEPAKAVLLNFSGVEFIDSGALGMLLLLRDEYLKKHIPVTLDAAHGQVEKVFAIVRFDQLFGKPGAT